MVGGTLYYVQLNKYELWMLSSGIPWNMPRITCIFRIHTSLYAYQYASSPYIIYTK